MRGLNCLREAEATHRLQSDGTQENTVAKFLAYNFGPKAQGPRDFKIRSATCLPGLYISARLSGPVIVATVHTCTS
jgi:hypothetical protein